MPEHGVTIPVPLRPRRERREAERFGATMPVSVDGAPATTRDISANGLSFLSERSYESGARVQVVIEYLLDGQQYPLRCEAEVVRSEPAEGGFRIGARLLPRPQLVPVSVANADTVQPAAGVPRPLRGAP
ncbi:PilZ domain-containing protein [Ramlibacter alkalitolerans]|uniref:PilZ domain-containing protein n=1 Tax=Ramlibacter alkalitolerans TaxID=2039631 RepID=A0ABS1JKH3_9BURK|nr:PilZ domain-containing protein [Ramlibacter alkalitolerans]MBL0424676.1 PilZ domain-containing protein [Ramlibacter alkalitolerans]